MVGLDTVRRGNARLPGLSHLLLCDKGAPCPALSHGQWPFLPSRGAEHAGCPLCPPHSTSPYPLCRSHCTQPLTAFCIPLCLSYGPSPSNYEGLPVCSAAGAPARGAETDTHSCGVNQQAPPCLVGRGRLSASTESRACPHKPFHYFTAKQTRYQI